MISSRRLTFFTEKSFPENQKRTIVELRSLNDQKMLKQISKTKIENRLRQKANLYLVDAIVKLKKTNPAVAKILATPRKKWSVSNLNQLDKIVNEGDRIFVAGKILSSGELTKKVTLISWSASEKALEKIKKSKSEFVSLSDELKQNKDLKGVKILQ